MRNLVFANHLVDCRKQGVRTAKTTLPVKALGGFFGVVSEVVTPSGFEPLAYRLGGGRSILLSYGA